MHLFIVEAEVDVDNICLLERYVLVARKLLLDGLDEFILESCYWRLTSSLHKHVIFKEIVVDRRPEPCLHRVIVYCHELHVKQLIIKLINIQHQSECIGIENAHQ